MNWFSEPPNWNHQDNTLTMTTAPDTDFWRKTHSGYVTDNGHFYCQQVKGDFTAEVKITGQYNDLYDQAGLMVRIDAENWIKCGVEYMEGVQHASVVVTREFSDWSVVPLPQNPATLWLRLKRTGNTVEVYYSLDNKDYAMLRQAYLPPVETLDVGLMACSPRGSGFEIVFEDYKVEHA